MHFREERHRGGARATPRNQSSSLEGSGHGGGLHSSPTLSAEGGNGTEPSSPDWSDSPSDVAIDIRSSGGAPPDDRSGAER